MPRERKTLAQIFKAQALFQQHRQLAPQATLSYRVFARQYDYDLHRADLALLEGSTRTPIQLDEQQRFVEYLLINLFTAIFGTETQDANLL